MKVLKKLLALLVVIFLITLISLWLLTELVKPEFIRSYLNSYFSGLTHQNSEVEGNISWQIFPRPGIKATKIRIGDEKKPSYYSAKLENLLFNLKITPLLSGKLVFNELKVDGFIINVHNQSPEFLISNPSKSKVTHESKSNLTEHFAIESFLLSHGRIHVNENNQTISLTGLQIGGEQFNLYRQIFPFQLKTDFKIENDKQILLKGQLNFKGSTSLSPLLFSNPFLTLKNTPLDGVVSLQHVKFKQFRIAELSAHTITRPGVILFNPLTLNLYNGESLGDLSYEFGSQKLTLNQTATNLDSSKFIKDLLNKSLFKGTLDLSIHAQTNLQNANWLNNTSGNGSFTIKNGMVESINLVKVIEDLSSKINQLFNGQTVKKEPYLDLLQFNNSEFFKGGTDFKLLTFQYQLKDANLVSNSLILQTDYLQLKGEGSLNLNNERIDAKVLAKIKDLNSGIGKVQQLIGGSFPIQLSGTLTEPNLTPDLQKINPILAQIWLKTTLTHPVETLGKTLKLILENGQQLL
ncbi:MAG: AsmA family protein [Tatlockia sp.]|nr:AsmA family protein [Tatlockia sp.]